MSIGHPESCDTFVVLPSATSDGCVIFAKNADRPKFEVQEVVYFDSADHDPDSQKLQVGLKRCSNNIFCLFFMHQIYSHLFQRFVKVCFYIVQYPAR